MPYHLAIEFICLNHDHFEKIGYFKFDSELKEIQTFPKSRFAVVYNCNTPFIHIYG